MHIKSRPFFEHSYAYMVLCLQCKTKATSEGVDNANPSFPKANQPLDVDHLEALKKWRNIETHLHVSEHNNHPRLFHNNANISNLVIPFLEECESIVVQAHISEVLHNGIFSCICILMCGTLLIWACTTILSHSSRKGITKLEMFAFSWNNIW